MVVLVLSQKRVYNVVLYDVLFENSFVYYHFD